MKCQGRQHEIEHKYIGGRWPQIEDAPDPTLIKWDNLGVSASKRRCYRGFSNLMAILLLLFSFYAVAVILNEKDKAKQNQWEPNVCDGQQFTAL